LVVQSDFRLAILFHIATLFCDPIPVESFRSVFHPWRKNFTVHHSPLSAGKDFLRRCDLIFNAPFPMLIVARGVQHRCHYD
jgi:hypothetical protein